MSKRKLVFSAMLNDLPAMFFRHRHKLNWLPLPTLFQSCSSRSLRSLSLSFLLRQPAIGNDQIVKMLEKPLTVMFVVKLSERRSTATAVQAGPLLPSLTASISNFAGASFVFRI